MQCCSVKGILQAITYTVSTAFKYQDSYFLMLFCIKKAQLPFHFFFLSDECNRGNYSVCNFLCAVKALQIVIHIKHKLSQSIIKHDYAFFNALKNKDKGFQ